jgi:hypothetical protein
MLRSRALLSLYSEISAGFLGKRDQSGCNLLLRAAICIVRSVCCALHCTFCIARSALCDLLQQAPQQPAPPPITC